MEEEQTEDCEPLAVVADDAGMGNLSSSEIGAADESSIDALLLNHDLRDLSKLVCRSDVHTAEDKETISAENANDELDKSCDASALETPEDSDQLAVISPNIPGDGDVTSSSTPSDTQTLDGLEDHTAKGNHDQELRGIDRVEPAFVSKPDCSSQQHEEHKLSNSSSPASPSPSISTSWALANSSSSPTTASVSELSLSVRRLNRPIKHPLRGSEYVTSVGFLSRRMLGSTDTVSSPPQKSVTPSERANETECSRTTDEPKPGVRRRGRPKGAKNKKTIALMNKTSSIRDSILEKLRAEVFGLAEPPDCATVRTNPASVTSSSSSTSALPSLPPSICSSISSILSRVLQPSGKVRPSVDTLGSVNNKERYEVTESCRGRMRSYQEMADGQSSTTVKSTAGSTDIGASKHPSTSILSLHSYIGVNAGTRAGDDLVASNAKENNAHEPSKSRKSKPASRASKISAKEHLEHTKLSKLSSTVKNADNVLKKKLDMVACSRDDNTAVATSPQPYPSQLAAGFNAIANIRLAAPLFSRHSNSTFVSGGLSESLNVTLASAVQNNLLADGMSHRQPLSFPAAAAVTTPEEAQSSLPSLEDLGSRRKKKKKKHHKHHKHRAEVEEITQKPVPELDDLVTHLEKIFITRPISAKVNFDTSRSVLHSIFRSNSKGSVPARREIWQQGVRSSLSCGVLAAGPAKTSNGRGRPRKKHLFERKVVMSSSKEIISSEQCLPLKKRHKLLAATQLEPTSAEADRNQKARIGSRLRRGTRLATQRRYQNHKSQPRRTSGFCC